MATEEKRPRTPATAAEVRDWARRKGMEVGNRGHLPPKVIKEFNRTHRKEFTSKNPFSGYKPAQPAGEE